MSRCIFPETQVVNINTVTKLQLSVHQHQIEYVSLPKLELFTTNSKHTSSHLNHYDEQVNVVFEFIVRYFHRFLDAGKTTFGDRSASPSRRALAIVRLPQLPPVVLWDDMPSLWAKPDVELSTLATSSWRNLDRPRYCKPWIFSFFDPPLVFKLYFEINLVPVQQILRTCVALPVSLRHLEKKVGWVQGFTGELTRNLPLTSTTILNDMDLTHMTLRDIHSIVRF